MKMTNCLVAFLLFFPGVELSVAQTAPVRPLKLGLCVGCHGVNGKATLKGYPNLAGQDRDYLVSAMTAYKNGQRANATMKSMMGSLSATDINELASYFSAQPCVNSKP
jgi:cytochrome c553